MRVCVSILALALLLVIAGCEISKQNVLSPPDDSGNPTDTTGIGDTTGVAVQVSVSPVATVVAIGETRQFLASVAGTANVSVVWSVESGPGAISTTGLYTPPASITADTVMTVIKLVSIADSTASARADITVVRRSNSGCDTANVTFAATIRPILQLSCTSCHAGGNPPGQVNLSNYSGVKAAADNGKLVGSITHASGFSAMPEGGAKLPDCTINKIKAWVNSGAPNN